MLFQQVEKGAIAGLLADAQILGERLDRGEGAKKEKEEQAKADGAKGEV